MKRKILGGALACMTLFAGTTGAMADPITLAFTPSGPITSCNADPGWTGITFIL